MDASRILLAQEFKQVLSKTIDEIVVKLRLYGGSLPVEIEFINLGVMLFKTQACPQSILEEFIHKCFPDKVKDENGNLVYSKDQIMDSEGKPINVWDQIKDRNEDILNKIGTEMFKQKFPMFATQGTEAISFVLKNRSELLGEELETKLWEVAEELVKKAIKYTHLRRHPKVNPETGVSQYTMRFAPEMKVKEEAKKWGVEL